jgi:hypothetical protein
VWSVPVERLTLLVAPVWGMVMADIAIDTTAPGYQTHLQNFRDVKTFYGPKIDIYYGLSEADQTAWRQSDPILFELLDFVRKVNSRENTS